MHKKNTSVKFSSKYIPPDPTESFWKCKQMTATLVSVRGNYSNLPTWRDISADIWLPVEMGGIAER